ncbi:hypothetical protein [Sphingobacterium bovistauri]|uniref:Late embryogenesis abundant protein n=1 Tax=Sphingobacterium bovistauri TaxID=2781959 RepID=A0ABS7Z1M1_9SPHI|nr:hypothetical protein [Sphingobacterium bovistauri]MCA5004071.1 hypothetical protein [Sphingobacterium bovistauri]
MIFYLSISLVAIIGLLAYFITEYRKSKVFNEYLDLNVSLDFNQITGVGAKSSHGLLLFNISEIRIDAKAICIDKIKFNSDKVKVRSLNTVSAKLPIPKDGIVLSIGVRRSKGFTASAAEHCSVSISGFLLEDRHKRIYFKKRVSVNTLSSIKST